MPRRQRRRRLSAVSLNASFNADATPARQSSVEPSDLEVSFIDIGQNDDNLERSKARKTRSRRKSMGAGMGMLTPVHSARRGSVRSRRGSQSPHSGGIMSSGRKKRIYTNEQLSQIYKDCIVKAQQGKINQQNAWNLKLVDNIKEITDLNTNNKENDMNRANRNNRNNKNKNDASFEAFARASHTIDAASKIYGYRVDSVHNKTYKVLGSIHQQNEGGNDDDALNGDEQNERKRKRQQRNRNVGRSTLCDIDKLHKLNETMKNLCVEVDPLFHKTASCFDEGGAKGLLMNTLYVQNGCDIVFDSNTKIEQNEDITNQGVVINNELIENEQEIEKENEWLTQLFTESFGKEVDINDIENNQFDGFTQIDTTSPDFDVSTQTKPQNFIIDMEWIKNSSVCPLINVFQHNITNINKNIPTNWDEDENGNVSQNNSGINDKATPEKDLNNGGNVEMFDNDNAFADDDDVLMDMPDFTIGGDQDLNAQDLFHEELLTQAHAPSNMQQRSLLMVNGSNIGNVNGTDLNNITIQNISNLQLDPNGIPINGINNNNIEYVLGQHGDNIGNMGVQPLLNNSIHFQMDNDQVLNNLQLEQEQHGAIHQKGIYKRGTMNITAMNQVISKLENADFESLTSFFDTKKHGNWAGPDQWYHRRYQMMTQSNNKNKKSRSPSRSVAARARGNSNSVINENDEEKSEQSPGNKRKKRGERKSTRFDFLSIANGNLIDENEFVEPPKSKNILSQAVIAKNMKSYHTLPKDLQIKPDMFIKLFHRPNYSVWKHWLRQHQLRMMKLRQDAVEKQKENNGDGDGDDAMAQQQQGMEGVSFADAMGMGDDGDAYQVNVSMIQQDAQNMIGAAKAVLLDNDNSNDAFQNEFQYNYNNPLDQSHFVPDLLDLDHMNNDQDDDNNNHFNFQLNGYDLIEMDPSKKLDKIKVEFATKAKKVNVRKLKLKLWDKIYTDLPSNTDDNQEQESMDSAKENNNSNINVDTDDDIDMDDNNNNKKEKEEEEEEKKMIKKTVTFQDTLDTLPSTISSSISIHMCFICLLHLANEKELQFVPNMKEEEKGDDSFKLDRGNFEIQYASANSQFEKDAMKINPIAVLGMQ